MAKQSRIFGGEKGWLQPLVHLTNNVISFIGVFLVTTAGVAWLFILPVELRQGADHPYLGIIFFALIPAAFLLGLLLIPLGIWLRLSGETKRHQLPEIFPPLTWKNQDFRRLLKFVAVATAANVVIGGYYTQATVHYMDSRDFCGTTCHTMTPEYTAYLGSPHLNVACVECHVGEGTGAAIRAKMRGVEQLVETATGNFNRPIPTPVHTLRPARDTCENCHWPQKFGGYRIRVWDKFAEDELNTQAKTVLMMRIGGGSMTTGIHGFHTAPGVVIAYAADPTRQTIPWVRYTDAQGNATEYATSDWTPETESEYEIRQMDCLDCHTRPSHQFLLPERALDNALALGDVDPSLPWANKTGLEILKAGYESTAEAEARIPAAFIDYYSSEHPEIWARRRADVEQSAAALVAIYKRNVFPEMKVDWGTYPDHIGHTDFPGCFRCHDQMHVSAEGRAISMNCSSCHQLLAMEESDPEVLRNLGIHP